MYHILYIINKILKYIYIYEMPQTSMKVLKA